MNPPALPPHRRALVAIAFLACIATAGAQTPPAAGEQTPPPAAAAPAVPAVSPAAADAKPVTLSDFAWLAGCWRGTVNQREFREQWMPLRGNLLVGVGQTVVQDRTQDFEFVRIERRADGLHYVTQPSGGRETSFRFADRQADGPDTIFTFADDTQDFPRRIVYRRGGEGWLYVHVEGRVQGEERRVIYPMRRIDCESGELILN